MDGPRPQTDTEWLNFLEVLGRTPPDQDGDWRVTFSKQHRNLREALAQTWENNLQARGAYRSMLEGRAEASEMEAETSTYKFYFLDEHQFRLLKKVEAFLYGPKIKTGDDIRDNANLLNLVLSQVAQQTIDENEIGQKPK
jgi:hypothetical protein